MNRRLTSEEKERVLKIMNPSPEHNYKDCNWFKVLSESEEGLQVEVGYWITYLNCRPKYEKYVIFLPHKNE